MKFAALISGGKDSFYNIYECLRNGHELIALANLHPEAKVDELDSFMFQTVGHEVIDFYSQCLNVPLYKQQINGGSINQELEYEVTTGDEIEDLYLLLSKVKKAHPDLDGISCGAILSSYQRIRVENVCSRLNLTCLAYMWQRNQYELMKEMCDSGLDARIIKVAAIGLSKSDLGSSIKELFPKLVKLNSMYDVHICGEGGEFETIVLDAPFFKHKKLKIIDQKAIGPTNEDVSYLKLDVDLVDKSQSDYSFSYLDRSLLSPEFQDIVDELQNQSLESDIMSYTNKTGFEGAHLKPNIQHLYSRTYVSNLIGDSVCDGVRQETISIFSKLDQIAQSEGLSKSDTIEVTLLVRSMDTFSEINEIYKSYFKNYLPPARICIATILPGDSRLQLSCVYMSSGFKTGIHIQSRSYWAPQNIGPYSQAIVQNIDSYQYGALSGQIPLIPSEMKCYPCGSKKENAMCSALSLQHLHRVMNLISLTDTAFVRCFIDDERLLHPVLKTWELYCASINETVLSNNLTVLMVSSLPMNAKIEWASVNIKEIKSMYDDETEEIGINDKNSSLAQVSQFSHSATFSVAKAKLRGYILYDDNFDILNEFLSSLGESKSHTIVFTSSQNFKLIDHQVEWFPVLAVWNASGKSYAYCVRCFVDCH